MKWQPRQSCRYLKVQLTSYVCKAVKWVQAPWCNAYWQSCWWYAAHWKWDGLRKCFKFNKFGTTWSMRQRPFNWYFESRTSTAGRCIQWWQKEHGHLDLLTTASNAKQCCSCIQCVQEQTAARTHRFCSSLIVHKVGEQGALLYSLGNNKPWQSAQPVIMAGVTCTHKQAAFWTAS